MDEKVIRYLKENGIDHLYHFTSRKNWPGIREKGICSLSFLSEQGLEPIAYGSDQLDREIRRRKTLDSFVSLSFSAKPPFLAHARKAGFLDDYIAIKIDLEVLRSPGAFIYDTLFQDEKSVKGESFDFVRSLRLDLICNASVTPNDSLEENRSRQAEVLVKQCIPPEYILNSDEIDAALTEDASSASHLFLIVLDQTDTMMLPVSLEGIHYPTCTELSRKMVNETVPLFIPSQESFSSFGNAENSSRNEITIIGYGGSSTPEMDQKPEKTVIRTIESLRKEQRETGEVSDWLAFFSENMTLSNPNTAFLQVRRVVRQWLFTHPVGSDVVVIHITNGRSIKKHVCQVEKTAQELLSNPSVQLSNLQLVSHTDRGMLFVSDKQNDDLDAYGAFLWRISSDAPEDSHTETSRHAMFVNIPLSEIVKRYLSTCANI